MAEECRRCRDWRGCPGRIYTTYDSEGNVIDEYEWYSYAEIQWCKHQVFWILKHAHDFDAGRWPKPPQVLECDAKRSIVSTEAPFCKIKGVIAEVRVRLAGCRDKGRILAEQAVNREKMMYLEDDISDVLAYVSGWRRKNTPCDVYLRMRRSRYEKLRKA